MNTKIGSYCDKLIEACWLGAVILSPLYMNIYTHRMFEPDKACVVRSLALLSIVFSIVKLMESRTGIKLPEIQAGKGGGAKPNQSAPVPPGGTPVRTTSAVGAFVQNPIFITFALFITAYIIAVIYSAVPYNSIWGGYDRLQGLYTHASFWVLFLMAALNIKTRDQINRLISAVIFTSIPIVAYGFIQRLGLDPVPWQQMNPSERVSATMGNPIFLSAYLILTIPLTVSRFVHFLVKTKLSPSTVVYGVITILQIITVFLSQSRGPMMGMFAGLFAFVIIYAWTNRKKMLLAAIFGLLIFGIIFTAVFNLPHIKIIMTKQPQADEKVLPVIEHNPDKTLIVWTDTANNRIVEAMPGWWHSTFGKLLGIKYVRQLGLILEKTPKSSGRTRIILWQGVWKLINDKDEPYRFFIGWGPESLSTVYYKNYIMELADLEGANVHADRSHNAYLDLWVMTGLFGLIAFVLMIGAVFYIALKTGGRRKALDGTWIDDPYNLLSIGLLAVIVSHLVEIIVGIPIISTLSHFWIVIGAIYALYRLKKAETGEPVMASAESKPVLAMANKAKPARPNDQQIGQAAGPADRDKTRSQDSIPKSMVGKKGLAFFAAYVIISILIALVLFNFFWGDASRGGQDKNTFLLIYVGWVFFGFIVGLLVWTPYLFWTYVAQSLILVVIMVRRYWPDDNTNTDALIIYTWLWMLAGLVVGAVFIKRREKPAKFGYFSNVLFGTAILAGVSVFIIYKNLYPLRADGFYKFCYSYDMSAEEFIIKSQNEKDPAEKKRLFEMAYRIRMDCIRFFQSVFRFNPGSTAYLNGAGRNFLELSKIVEKMDTVSKDDKLVTPLTIKEIVNMDTRKFYNFSKRDLFLCSYTCIQRAYELDTKNFERIIAMIRVYRFWGELDRNASMFDKGLALCEEARKASPLNKKVDREIDELKRLKNTLR